MNTQPNYPVFPERYRVAVQCVTNNYTYKDYIHYLTIHHIPHRITLKEYQRMVEEYDQNNP